jgi:hypothetical protein
MRIGVRLGPVWVSTSTHSRRRSRSRSRSSQPNWHAKGKATTPDGREVDFRCQHGHRSQDAALKCAATVRKQIEHGQSQHLITRVRSTPASREAARQRTAQQEARRKAKAAERAQAAQQRAARREAGRQAKTAQRAQASQQRAEQQETYRRAEAAERAEAARYHTQQSASPVIHQHPAATPPQFAHRTPQRTQRREEAGYPLAGQWQPVHQRNDEPWNRVSHQYAEPSRQRSLSWPITGLIIAGAATILGMVLAGMAGTNSHSALATTAGGVITLSLIALVVFVTAALLQRRTRRRNKRPRSPMPENHDPRIPSPSPSFPSSTPYPSGAYPSPIATERPPHGAPPRPYSNGAPWPPYGNSTQWPR